MNLELAIANRLELAIALAAAFHGGQQDKAGRPYILHCLRVMLAVGAAPPVTGWTQDDEMIVAVLHDALEDTDATLDALVDIFGDKVGYAVQVLTHEPGESYADYIFRVKADPCARKVKLADIADNLGRADSLPEHDRIRLVKRYQLAVKVLS